jgi:hypothetical protein
MNKNDLIITGGAAAIGFVLSLVVNIFSFNGVSIMMSRAMVGALLLGGAVFASLLLLKQLVPELYQAVHGEGDLSDSAQDGGEDDSGRDDDDGDGGSVGERLDISVGADDDGSLDTPDDNFENEPRASLSDMGGRLCCICRPITSGSGTVFFASFGFLKSCASQTV